MRSRLIGKQPDVNKNVAEEQDDAPAEETPKDSEGCASGMWVDVIDEMDTLNRFFIGSNSKFEVDFAVESSVA